ncbi:AarF/UbiB family protein [Streptomyces canus]|uniref:AarF/ABC1/UbiB kinase family protein n=1 Tax=Streptomyces canus TaxID=58343 RepID=UPI0036ED6C29
MRGRTAPMAAPVAQLARVREIATVLWAGGFTWLVDALGLRSCVSLRCRTLCWGCGRASTTRPWTNRCPSASGVSWNGWDPPSSRPARCSHCAPTTCPPPTPRRCAACTPPFPADQAARVVTEELGRPPQEAFAAFEPEPFAAASLSQVHRARLPNGTEVAVKVQRPGAARQVQADLALLRRLARRLARRSPTARRFRPADAVDELAEWTLRELDFRQEARTARALRRHFADDDTVVIPRVHEPWTTRRVLTMDLIEGQPPAPAAELRRTGLDPQLGAGAAHGIVFPRELMLLARTLLTLESTGALIDPDTTLADLTRAVLPDLKRILLPTPATLAHTWADTRLDTLALDLPDVLQRLDDLLNPPAAQPDPPPPRPRPPLLALLAAGAALARLVHRRDGG